MATVSEELMTEGQGLLDSRNADEILKLSDRIISVEPDNWYGLYLRGCGYALEADFLNCVSNWNQFIEKLDDDSMIEKFSSDMCVFLAHCLTHVSGRPELNFESLSNVLTAINDKLPESDDEFFVSRTLALGLESVRSTSPAEPILTYYTFKALVFCSFRVYVEMPLIVGFFETLAEIGKTLMEGGPAPLVKIIEKELLFLNDFKNAIETALAGVSPEDLEKIEEYWLSHNNAVYMGPLQQAYNASAAVSSGGWLLSKMGKKLVSTQTQLFIAKYFGVKN